MATARGITDTKIYDHQAVIDRYGIPPGADPRLLRAEGRHLRQHPRRPRDRRQDRLRADPALRLARGGARAHPRHQRRQAQTEPARARRERARLQAPGDRRARRRRSTSTPPPRPRASPTARACARCSASTSCATPCAAWRRRSATPSWRRPAGPTAEVRLTGRVRAGAVADIARLAASRARSGTGAELCVAVRATETPEGALFAEGAPGASPSLLRAVSLRAPAGGEAGGPVRGARRRLRGPRGGRRRVRGAPGGRPRREGARAGADRASSTTRCSAPTCWSPRGAATPSPSSARSAACVCRRRGPRGRATRCCWARSRRGSASRSPSAAWRG